MTTNLAQVKSQLERIEKLLQDLWGGLAISGAQVVTTSQLKNLEAVVEGLTTVPTGGQFVGIFIGAGVVCPTGWTRWAAADGVFLRGAATYGGTGGASTHTHTGVNAHSHGLGAASVGSAGGHDHSAWSLVATTGGAHNHEESGNKLLNVFASGSTSYDAIENLQNTSTDGAHGHGISGNTSSDGSHSHSLSGSTDSSGSGLSNASSLPPYIDVVLCSKD